MGDILNTIMNWPRPPFHSLLLNSLWNFLPGFVYWVIWKERNNKIFKNHSMPLDTLWLLLKQNLQETLALRHWKDSDLPVSPQECLILANWNLDLTFLAHIKPNSSIHSESPQFWSPPAIHPYKLNFDGAAKGNPRLAGYGGIFRDAEGSILHIYHGSLGRDTNNTAELEGLWKGICTTEIIFFFLSRGGRGRGFSNSNRCCYSDSLRLFSSKDRFEIAAPKHIGTK